MQAVAPLMDNFGKTCFVSTGIGTPPGGPDPLL